MILSKKQEEGLRIAVERYKNHEPWTCIAGYAGTGKSTLIKFIVAALDLRPEDICYVAYTGKAATILQQKGCPNATTAHQLLYHARPLPDGTFKFVEKTSLEFKVIVVDEVSMLPKSMWNRLLKHNVYVLACGDPGQLPPVDKDEDNHVLDNPHIFLDEIMRQAQDSEIIRLSMWIRDGKALKDFPYLGEQVKIFSPKEVVSGMYNWADQTLCATNNTRNYINSFVREQKGLSKEPAVGDKVISLHNHWDYFSHNGTWALTNGAIGTIANIRKQEIYVPRYINNNPVKYMFSDIVLDDLDQFTQTPIDYLALTTGESALNAKQHYLWRRNTRITISPPFDFSYAYAITCHKAQGSEWDKVLVFEEGFPYNAEEHKRWLYTAITRAKEKVVAIRSE